MRTTTGIRAVAVVGCLGTLVAGANVLLLPAAIVGLLAGVAGVRRLGDALEAASLRLGVALVVSGVLAVFSVASGVPTMAVVGLVTVVAFAVAWRACERLRADRRAAWGVQQRDGLARDAALHRRRDELRDRPRS